MNQPLLLPIPRDLQLSGDGTYMLTSADMIQIPAHTYLFTAKWLQSA